MLEESFSKEEQGVTQERKKVLDKIKMSKRGIDFRSLNEHARKHDQMIHNLSMKKNEQNRSTSELH